MSLEQHYHDWLNANDEYSLNLLERKWQKKLNSTHGSSPNAGTSISRESKQAQELEFPILSVRINGKVSGLSSKGSQRPTYSSEKNSGRGLIRI